MTATGGISDPMAALLARAERNGGYITPDDDGGRGRSQVATVAALARRGLVDDPSDGAPPRVTDAGRAALAAWRGGTP